MLQLSHFEHGTMVPEFALARLIVNGRPCLCLRADPAKHPLYSEAVQLAWQVVGRDFRIGSDADPANLRGQLRDLGREWDTDQYRVATAASGSHTGLEALGIGWNVKNRQKAAHLALAVAAAASGPGDGPKALYNLVACARPMLEDEAAAVMSASPARASFLEARGTAAGGIETRPAVVSRPAPPSQSFLRGREPLRPAAPWHGRDISLIGGQGIDQQAASSSSSAAKRCPDGNTPGVYLAIYGDSVMERRKAGKNKYPKH